MYIVIEYNEYDEPIEVDISNKIDVFEYNDSGDMVLVS